MPVACDSQVLTAVYVGPEPFLHMPPHGVVWSEPSKIELGQSAVSGPAVNLRRTIEKHPETDMDTLSP